MEQPVALVTGASRGIGKACAQALAQAGYQVALHYRSGQRQAEELSTQLLGSRPFQADLSVEEDCKSLVQAVKAEMGRIDVLVNNAGICIDQILAMAKVQDFDQMVATNLKSTFLVAKFASKQMIRQRKGRIVNLSSVVGFTGNAGQSAYAATKAAIIGFTKSIAQELAPAGITCNCVAPGFIETDMTAQLDDKVKESILSKVPMKRLGSPEEVAAAVAFLASDQASYITGTTLHVNGGMYTT